MNFLLSYNLFLVYLYFSRLLCKACSQTNLSGFLLDHTYWGLSICSSLYASWRLRVWLEDDGGRENVILDSGGPETILTAELFERDRRLESSVDGFPGAFLTDLLLRKELPVVGLRWQRIPHALHRRWPSEPVRHCEVSVRPQRAQRRSTVAASDAKRPVGPRVRVVEPLGTTPWGPWGRVGWGLPGCGAMGMKEDEGLGMLNVARGECWEQNIMWVNYIRERDGKTFEVEREGLMR